MKLLTFLAPPILTGILYSQDLTITVTLRTLFFFGVEKSLVWAGGLCKLGVNVRYSGLLIYLLFHSVKCVLLITFSQMDHPQINFTIAAA